MSETYATAGPDDTETGKIILVVVAALSALLVIAGLIYATGTGGRQQAALTAAGCEPGLSSNAHDCVTQPMLAREYQAMLTPATRQLTLDEGMYTLNETGHLAAAEAALTSARATARALDAGLAGLGFPPAITPLVQALIRADASRTRLLAEQARSSSLTQLRSYDHRVKAANAAVLARMNVVGQAVSAPVGAA
jgi:hypothetical protein